MSTDLLSLGFSLARILAAVIAAYVIMWVIKVFVHRIARRTATAIDDQVMVIVRRPIFIAVILVGVNSALRTLPFMNPYIDAIHQGMSVLWTLLGGFVGYRLVDTMIGHLAQRKKSSSVLAVVKPFSLIFKILVTVSIVLTVTGIFGIDLGPYVLGWGLLGFAVVLSLQPVLMDLFSGVYVVLAQPYKIGNRLKLSTGELVEVLDIGTQKTVLRDIIEGNLISVPNAEMLKMKVADLSESKLRLVIPLQLTQNSDIEKAKMMALEIAQATPDVSTDPKPAIYVMDISGSTVKMELVVWVSHLEGKFATLDWVNSEIKRRFTPDVGVHFPS